MNTVRLLPALALALSGCATFYDPVSVREQEMAERQRQAAQQERYDRMRDQLESLQSEVAQLRQELAKVRQEAGSSSRLQSLEESVANLGRRIDGESEARQREQRNMIDTVSKMVASSSRSSSSSSRSTSSSPRKATEGYVHKVERGQTLSAIASAYKTTTASILSANQISNPNSLREGQELIIPKP